MLHHASNSQCKYTQSSISSLVLSICLKINIQWRPYCGVFAHNLSDSEYLTFTQWQMPKLKRYSISRLRSKYLDQHEIQDLSIILCFDLIKILTWFIVEQMYTALVRVHRQWTNAAGWREGNWANSCTLWPATLQSAQVGHDWSRQKATHSSTSSSLSGTFVKSLWTESTTPES